MRTGSRGRVWSPVEILKLLIDVCAVDVSCPSVDIFEGKMEMFVVFYCPPPSQLSHSSSSSPQIALQSRFFVQAVSKSTPESRQQLHILER